MRTITRKSLDELAATMTVIEKAEQEAYNGLYANDCFWRCVAFLKTGIYSEAVAAGYAYNYFKDVVYSAHSNPSGLAMAHLLANGAGVDETDRNRALQAYNLMTSSTADNRIVGLAHTNDLAFYKNNSDTISAYANHCLILEKSYESGVCDMFDPQNNVRFSISSSEATKLKPINWY